MIINHLSARHTADFTSVLKMIQINNAFDNKMGLFIRISAQTITFSTHITLLFNRLLILVYNFDRSLVVWLTIKKMVVR